MKFYRNRKAEVVDFFKKADYKTIVTVGWHIYICIYLSVYLCTDIQKDIHSISSIRNMVFSCFYLTFASSIFQFSIMLL